MNKDLSKSASNGAFDLKKDSRTYVLSDPQKESIEISRKEIKKGEFAIQHDFFNELREWLRNK